MRSRDERKAVCNSLNIQGLKFLLYVLIQEELMYLKFLCEMKIGMS